MTQSARGTVAITGASGYLGGVIQRRLTADGWSTLSLVRTVRDDRSRRYVIDEEPAADLLDGVDVLVHCAYDMTLRRRDDIWRVNVDGTRLLLKAAERSGVGLTVVLSSMSAYDGTAQLYGLSKLDIERDASRVGAVSVRPGLVYGPNAGGMAGTLGKLTALPLVPVVASSAHQFTVHEDDFAEAVAALIMAGRGIGSAGPIGIANPQPVPFRQVIEGLARMQDNHCRTVAVDWRLVYAFLRTAERLPVALPFRADSLLGLARPAPTVPNLAILDGLGVSLRRFGQPVPPVVRVQKNI
jgi:nucleoside-diphosphate-sugar epimerase